MAGPFVYNIIPGKSGKRAFDVKISNGHIVHIIYMAQIYGLHYDFRYILRRSYTYRCSTPLHRPTCVCIYHSHTYTPTNTLVKTLNASNGHSPYTIYILYVYRRAHGEKSRGVVFLFARGVRPPLGHRGEGCSSARIDV